MANCRAKEGPAGTRSGGRVRSLALGVAFTMSLILAGFVAGCREDAPDDVIRAEHTTDALVFVKTRGEETLNRSNAEGNLYKLSPISPDGRVTPITAFTGASVSDPSVSFDGKRILFSLRPAGGGARNIYEINADGSGLRQITTGGGNDFDPLYLPDDRILFTSSRAGEMDEYNHARAEHLYACNLDGSGLERISFNQSDDFDPTLLPDGRIAYTRWEHFGNFNRFPLFFTNPDGTGTFHMFGPHNRNFFHVQPTPDGRLIAVESTRINMDAGPIAVLKLEEGPADPAGAEYGAHWDVLTTQVNNDGAPWAYGAFKYPFPLGGNRYAVSYTLPAATEGEVDYGLYTFSLRQRGAGTPEDPATLEVVDLTFLYNDPDWNEYDAQLLAPRDKPPVIPSTVDRSVDSGVFLAQDIFNRGTRDGQEVPVRGADPIDRIAVIASRPTRMGDANDFSANEFEKRALIGFAPVQPDGSFRIRVPADTPITFATLDDLDRGFVVKRTWLYVRPGEEFNQCIGCHEDRQRGKPAPTNPDPVAASLPPTDLNLSPEQFQIINFEKDIAPILEAKCVSCHSPEPFTRREVRLDDGTTIAVLDSLPPAGDLDLRLVLDPTVEDMRDRQFPIGYLNLSGEPMETAGRSVVSPVFPRRSVLIDYVLGVGERADLGPHPEGEYGLTELEKQTFNLWVLLGAQYR